MGAQFTFIETNVVVLYLSLVGVLLQIVFGLDLHVMQGLLLSQEMKVGFSMGHGVMENVIKEEKQKANTLQLLLS